MWQRVPPLGGFSPVRAGGPCRVMVGAHAVNDHSCSQQRMVKVPTMESAELHAVTVRLDVLRDIMIELAAALPPDRTPQVACSAG